MLGVLVFVVRDRNKRLNKLRDFIMYWCAMQFGFRKRVFLSMIQWLQCCVMLQDLFFCRARQKQTSWAEGGSRC